MQSQVVVPFFKGALAVGQSNFLEFVGGIWVFVPQFDGIFQTEQRAVEAIVVPLRFGFVGQNDGSFGEFLAAFDVGPFFLDCVDCLLQIFYFCEPLHWVGL